jgi:hypothetical protein
MFTFRNVESYFHPHPVFPDAIYFRDSLGRDFYEERNKLTDGCHVVTVGPTGEVVGFTTCIVNKPTSLLENVSLFEVDPETLPATFLERCWDWKFDESTRSVYKEEQDAVTGL